MSKNCSESPFYAGLRAAVGAPPLMVLFAMVGFGSLANSQQISIWNTLFSAAAIYGMPGQVAMLELHATGASALAVIAGVSMANMRFFPMTVVLMPMFAKRDPWYRLRFVVVQALSINSWTHCRDILPGIEVDRRLGFFAGFASLCFAGGLAGAALGWMLASVLPTVVTLVLVFLNPAYFIFLFSCNTRPDIVCALVVGMLLGPPLYLVSADWGLLLCGVIAGTVGFLIPRLVSVR